MNLISRINRANQLSAVQDTSGFTLIEVMIALFILILIGTTTSKAVIDAAKLKEVLKDETEFASEFRTSTAFIDRDLSQVFNPRWFLAPDFKPLDPYAQPVAAPPQVPGQAAAPQAMSIEEITRKTRGAAFQSFEFWGPMLDSSGIRASRFKGKQDSMSFVAASHVRIYQQKKESIYAKVRYELIKQPPNPSLTDQENAKFASLHALVKIENTRVFDPEEPKEAPYINTYVILNNIKSIKFSYFKKDAKEPVKEWDSESQDQKGIFPTAVEMDVSLVGPKERNLDEKVLFNLESPNDVLPKTY